MKVEPDLVTYVRILAVEKTMTATLASWAHGWDGGSYYRWWDAIECPVCDTLIQHTRYHVL